MRSLPRLRIVVSYRAARSRIARFVTGSIAVHGALLFAVLVVPMARHRAAPIPDTMVVALVGPVGAPPAIHVGTSAPPIAKPEPAPAPPKEAHTVREVPVPKPKAKTDKPKKEPAKTPEPAAPAAPAIPQGNAKEAVNPGVPSGAQSAVTAMLGGGDSSLGWYGAAVKAALESAWAKPYLEDTRDTASVVVAFDIFRDGATRNLRVVQTSGIPSLDRSALRAVIEASPLPALPPTWTDDTLPVTMRFDLSPEAR